MQDKYSKIERFLSACDELVSGKYILADTNMGEVLRAIAASEELTALFDAVTAKFDYARSKRAYLVYPADGASSRGAAYLPTERGDILAFVFCLLVEFDSGSMRFNDFLLRYFYEDGSYTASYALFADRVMRPFRDIVRSCYPEVGKSERLRYQKKVEESVFGGLSERVAIERARIAGLDLDERAKRAGEILLTELYAAVGREDLPEVQALLVGYSYYLNGVHASDESSAALFALAEKLN
ncbi:MAG: hypothetical protein K2L87_06590 [Clostridiales bacterium]|nr:hypothetical protein [Clostridiales bacterium]